MVMEEKEILIPTLPRKETNFSNDYKIIENPLWKVTISAAIIFTVAISP